MRHGWQIALLFIGLVGCAKEKQQGSGWVSLPVAIYTDPLIGSTQDGRSDFYAAMGFWESRAGKKIFDYKGDWTGDQKPYTGNASKPDGILANVAFFQNPWPFAGNTAGMTTVITSNGTYQGAVIMLNPSIPLCSGNCWGDSFRTSRQRLLAHEMGHFIGLSHSADASNIMYSSLSPGGSLESDGVDTAALKAVGGGQ
jgi:hypothetical protein